MFRTTLNVKNEQRAITQKLDTVKVWFLCNALLFNVNYPQLGNVDTCCSFRDKVQSVKMKKGQ